MYKVTANHSDAGSISPEPDIIYKIVRLVVFGCARVVYQPTYYMCLNHQSSIFYLYHVNPMLMPAIGKINDAGS